MAVSLYLLETEFIGLYLMTRNIIFIITVLLTAFSDSLLVAAEPDAQFDDDSWLDDDSEFRSLEKERGQVLRFAFLG